MGSAGIETPKPVRCCCAAVSTGLVAVQARCQQLVSGLKTKNQCSCARGICPLHLTAALGSHTCTQNASIARCILRARKYECRPTPEDAAAVPAAPPPAARPPKLSVCCPGASSASASNLTTAACCSSSGLQVDQLHEGKGGRKGGVRLEALTRPVDAQGADPREDDHASIRAVRQAVFTQAQLPRTPPRLQLPAPRLKRTRDGKPNTRSMDASSHLLVSGSAG